MSAANAANAPRSIAPAWPRDAPFCWVVPDEGVAEEVADAAWDAPAAVVPVPETRVVDATLTTAGVEERAPEEEAEPAVTAEAPMPSVTTTLASG